MKVTFKLLIVYFLALLLMTAVSSYLTVSRIYESYETSHRALLDRVAQEVERELQKTIARQRAAERAEEFVEEHQEHLVALLGDDDVPFTEPFHEDVKLAFARRTPSTLRTVWVDKEGRRILTVYRPVGDGRGAVGALELTGSLDALDDEAQRTVLQNLAVLGVAAIIGLAMAYFAGDRWIAEPLERLIDKTRRIGQGDLGDPVKIQTHDELQELGRSMNEMCDRIAAQQDAIRRETAEKLSATDQLRHADRLKTVGRLAAGIAHELGTPLNVVTGRAGMIASGSLSPEAMRSNAVIIKQESERIAQIVRGLLDFARRKPAQQLAFDLADVARRTTTLLQPLALKSEVTVETAADDSVRVVGDAGQIQQATTNLVMNAVQASKPGATVRVSVEEQTFDPAALPSVGLRLGTLPERNAGLQDYVVLAVQDQGVGIEPENLSHLVEPFFTTKDVGEGTGLGLSIVYGIVQDHGGWLEADSAPGAGSTFRIVLPKELGQ